MVAVAPTRQTILLVGKESVGKSQLVSALTGQVAYSANFPGTTVACDLYAAGERHFIDTPGLLRQSDSAAAGAVLARLGAADTVLLVVQATRLDDDLDDLLPLVAGKRGVVAVTFWDKVAAAAPARLALERLSAAVGAPFVALDARRPGAGERARLLAALATPGRFDARPARERFGRRVEPRPTVLERPWLGPLVALALLLLPAVAAVWAANTLAGLVDPGVQAALRPLAAALATLPAPLAAVLAGPYGLVGMGPLLVVWAAPTVIAHALILGAYKASGLLDRLTTALHPWLRPVGLSGRDLARVLMGFGCNVPAVISTRACSTCTRGSCIAAIAFGAACSYQFGATLGVFSALGQPGLVVPYLLYLAATTLLYTRLTAPPAARSRRNLLVIEGRSFLVWPRPATVWREARATLGQFFARALPIFVGITLIASLLDWLGVLPALAGVLGPIMGLVRLPTEAALPVVLASIRKDGILLFAQADRLALLTPLQVLTGVYLAGVLLPCLVTALTIAREQGVRPTMRLLGQQALAAVAFTLLLAWGGALLGW